MSEQERIDGMLSQLLSGPVPSLSPAFDRRLLRKVRRHRLSGAGRLALACYGAATLAISVVVMRQMGIGWDLITASAVVPLVMVAIVLRRRLGLAAG